MRKHRGMRPQDIVILLKIATFGQRSWQNKELAESLGISASEVSESLHRSRQAGLLASDKKQLMINALLEFLEHGFKYIFPQQPGALVRGVPTAHSAPPLDKHINGDEIFVWPAATGVMRGQAIEPLHPGVPKACLADPSLHELLALVDALRVGRMREQQLAIEELRKRIGSC